jgi:hypothetical protein
MSRHPPFKKTLISSLFISLVVSAFITVPYALGGRGRYHAPRPPLDAGQAVIMFIAVAVLVFICVFLLRLLGVKAWPDSKKPRKLNGPDGPQ